MVIISEHLKHSGDNICTFFCCDLCAFCVGKNSAKDLWNCKYEARDDVVDVEEDDVIIATDDDDDDGGAMHGGVLYV